MTFDVREQSEADVAAVGAVLRATFGRDSEAGLVERLRRRPDVFALVGVVEERVVGHVLFTPIEVVGARPLRPVLCVALLAVHPEFRSHGIGRRLVEAGLEECRRRGAGLVFVIGPPGIYGRSGFVAAAPLGIRCRWRSPPGQFQVRELEAGELERARGIVRYLPEFSA